MTGTREIEFNFTPCDFLRPFKGHLPGLASVQSSPRQSFPNMFLHSGASLHGHEYSNKQAPVAQQHTHHRSPLLRSAFAAPKPRPISLDGAASQPPSAVEFSRRPVSECIPRIVEPVVRFLEPLDSEDDDDLPTPMTEDVVSVSGSEFSDCSHPSEAASTPRRRRSRSRRPARTTTTYALAYPAPRFAAKSRVVKKVAPKLYLQLQEVSADKRPKPIIDVFPSSRIAGPVIAPRLAKRFPRLFGPKGELGSTDVVLMRSEDYDTVSEDADSDEEECGLEKRQPVAVLSPVRKLERTEIVLDDGSVWVAKPLPTGSFDFVHVNAHGVTTTARWVRRSSPKPASQQASEGSASRSSQMTIDPSETKYTFSIINPLSRRHPVMATLTPAFLNIQDSYTSVSTSSGRYPPSKPLGRANTLATPHRSSPLRPTSVRSLSMNAAGDDSDNAATLPEPANERAVHPVDDATKLLISVTAVWIALQSGWSPFYLPTVLPPSDHHTESVASGSATTSPPTTRLGRRGTRSRGNSFEITNLGPPPHAGPSNLSSASVGLRSRDQSPVGSLCSGTHLPPWWETRRATYPATSPPPAARSATPDLPSPLPRRATSTGAAFMERARIASINRVEEQSDAEQHKQCPRILSGGGQRTMIRHSIGATPTPAQEPVTEAESKVSDKTVDRSFKVNIASHSQPERQVQSAYYPPPQPQQASRNAKHASIHMAPAQLKPLMVVPEVPMVAEPHRKANFSTKMKNIGHWFRRLGAHSGTH